MGQGSTFTVYIPLSDNGQESIGSFAPEPGSVPASWTKAPKILFVDDELPLCNLCERHLKNSGYQVKVTADSREALEMVRNQPDFFDLLVTDQTMPDLTGIELAKEVLSINSMLPIIMCTGHSDIVSEEDALAVGIKRYLFKPFTKKELLDTIREVVEEQTPGNSRN
jgi:DNA-binding NtrC family response regulator